MKDLSKEIARLSQEFGAAPAKEEMPRRTLADKGIDGPTAAHVVEEVHVPLNLAYVTFTSGSTAFQNIVGVTDAELPERVTASKRALEKMGLRREDRLLVTYPPLVNVFSKRALDEYGVTWSFLERSSRDAFLSAMLENPPRAVIGESSFLRAALEDALRLGIAPSMPQGTIVVSSGSRMDLELLPVVERVLGGEVHDLYGCQEVGWIAVDGCPVRDDVVLLPVSDARGHAAYEVVVGGLPIGDRFPALAEGHICDTNGKLITYGGERTSPEFEVVLKETTLHAELSAYRVARTILRIKGRVVKVAPDLVVRAPRTVLEVGDPSGGEKFRIEGPEKMLFFDAIARAQVDYQANRKNDPTWTKRA